jgi:hypothetical protein
MSQPASLIFLVALLTQSPTAVFETNMPPGEGPHDFMAAGDQLILRALPSGESRTVRSLKVSPGQELPYDQARYRTTREGHIRVVAPFIVKGRMIGQVRYVSGAEYGSDRYRDVELPVTAGADIGYVQYRSEGTCFVRMGKDVIDAAPCPALDRSLTRVESEPAAELWIHVSLGSSVGWLRIEQTSAKEVPL